MSPAPELILGGVNSRKEGTKEEGREEGTKERGERKQTEGEDICYLISFLDQNPSFIEKFRDIGNFLERFIPVPTMAG